nr:putative reverse transcriptase domain, aspartic peptidase domain protein [Tanacetum cinerariifolium]
MDKRKGFKLTLEIFRDIMKSLNDVVVDHMHQPWRTFAALINKSLSGKTTALNKLRLSIAQSFGIRAEIRKEFRTGSGPSGSGENPPPVSSSPGVPLRATPTRSALRVDVDTQESIVELLIISALQARTLLSHGCEGFLATIHDTTSDVPSIHDQPIVSEFPDVFLDELPGIPPVCEVKFSIELIPGAEPILKAPYRMAPIELKELKDQLQELLERGFIHLSVLPWGAPVLFVKKKDGSMRLCIDYRELNK